MRQIQRKDGQSMPSGPSCPPSPFGRGVGSRFWCACGYNLAVHSAQKQHEPESPKHLSYWDVMGMWDAKKQHCRERWNTGKEGNRVSTIQNYRIIWYNLYMNMHIILLILLVLIIVYLFNIRVTQQFTDYVRNKYSPVLMKYTTQYCCTQHSG